MRASGGGRLLFLVATIARKKNLELLCQHLFFRAMGKKQEMHLVLANIRTSSSTGICTTYMKTGRHESPQLCNVEKVGKNFLVTFHVLQHHYFPFRSTQQKVTPCRVLHGLSVELLYFIHRATCKKLLPYYTVSWFTDRGVVHRRFSLV
jgi:hypothetical protein